MLDSGAYNLRRAIGRPLVRHTRAKLTPLLPRCRWPPEETSQASRSWCDNPAKSRRIISPRPCAPRSTHGRRECAHSAMFSATALSKSSTLARSVRTFRTASPLGSGFKVFGGSRPVAAPGERTSCASCSNVASLIPGFTVVSPSAVPYSPRASAVENRARGRCRCRRLWD
jgi:hypothetical protein